MAPICLSGLAVVVALLSVNAVQAQDGGGPKEGGAAAPKAPAPAPDIDAKVRGAVRPVDLSAFPVSYHSEFVAGPASGFDGAYLMMTRVPPKFAGLPLHRHSSDQIYFVLNGEMTLQLGTDIFKVGPDTAVVIPAGSPHRNWNVTDQEEVHIEMLVPPPPRDRLLIPAQPSKIDDDAASLIRRVADVARGGTLGIETRLLAQRSSGAQRVAIRYEEIRPKASEQRLHISKADQVYFVIDGVMDLQIGLNTYSVKPNSYVIVPAGTVSCRWNAGGSVERNLSIVFSGLSEDAQRDVPVTIISGTRLRPSRPNSICPKVSARR